MVTFVTAGLISQFNLTKRPKIMGIFLQKHVQNSFVLMINDLSKLKMNFSWSWRSASSIQIPFKHPHSIVIPLGNGGFVSTHFKRVLPLLLARTYSTS